MRSPSLPVNQWRSTSPIYKSHLASHGPDVSHFTFSLGVESSQERSIQNGGYNCWIDPLDQLVFKISILFYILKYPCDTNTNYISVKTVWLLPVEFAAFTSCVFRSFVYHWFRECHLVICLSSGARLLSGQVTLLTSYIISQWEKSILISSERHWLPSPTLPYEDDSEPLGIFLEWQKLTDEIHHSIIISFFLSFQGVSQHLMKNSDTNNREKSER
jgi:hypothetical protein